GLLSGLDVDATVGDDGADGSGSLIDVDIDADTTGDIDGTPLGGGLLGGDLLGGDLLGGGLLGGDLISGELVDDTLGTEAAEDDPSLLNLDLDGHTASDGSTIDLGAEEIVGEDSIVTEIVESVEDVVDDVAGDFLG